VIWVVATGHLAVHKPSFKLPPLREICKNKMTHVTEEDWNPLCGRAKQMEYAETYCVVDDATEKLTVSWITVVTKVRVVTRVSLLFLILVSFFNS
jgi:hypothetical protein